MEMGEVEGTESEADRRSPPVAIGLAVALGPSLLMLFRPALQFTRPGASSIWKLIMLTKLIR